MVSFNDVTIGKLSAGMKEISGGGSLSDKSVIHAKVVDYSNGKALLEVDGRMVSADSDVPLKPNSEFDLVVKGQEQGGRVNLQVLGARESGSSSVRPLTDTMIASRLIGFDLPDHDATIPAAKALINNGVAVTKSAMDALLAALPKDAPQNIIDFAAALVRENLPATRELLALAADLSKNLDELPAQIKTAAESAVANQQTVADGESERPAPSPSGAKPDHAAAPAETRSPQTRAAGFMEPLPADDAAETAARLPDIIKTFMSSTEARIRAFAEAAVSFAPETPENAKLADSLVSLVKIIPSDIAPDEPVEHLETAVRNISALVQDAKPETAAGAAAKESLLALASEINAKGATPENVAALRDAAAQALSLMGREIMAATADGPTAPPALFSPLFAKLSADIDSAIKIIDSLFLARQTMTTTPMKSEAADLVSLASTLSRVNFDSEATPALKEFAATLGKWAAEETAAAARQQPDAASARADAGRAAPEPRAQLLEALRELSRSESFAREFSTLASLAKDALGPRAALANLSDAGLSARQSAEIARGFQMANLANVVQHNGAEPLNYMVSYFPFRVGDSVSVGKLQVFKREGEDRHGGKRNKTMNPFDAVLALILDTEFLGLSTITLKTFPDKSLSCEIELPDRRRKNIVEKHSDELIEGLANTEYEKCRVTVSERRRKPGPVEKKKLAEEKKFSSVDMRV